MRKTWKATVVAVLIFIVVGALASRTDLPAAAGFAIALFVAAMAWWKTE